MVPYKDIPKWKRHFRMEQNRKTHDIHSYHCKGKPDEYILKSLQTFPENVSDSQLFKRSFKDKDSEPCHLMKFYRKDSPHAGRYPWKWPFLDVIFYKEDDIDVWNFMDPFDKKIPKSMFYPLIKWPFGSVEVFSPHSTLYWLKSRFQSFHCISSSWNHSKEKGQKKRMPSAGCSAVFDTYPHVEYHIHPQNPNLVTETLLFNNSVYNTFTFESFENFASASKRPFGF